MNERFTKNIILVSNTSGGGGGGTPPVITVATYADLPASPENLQQVVVLDNGINATAISVIWNGFLSTWLAVVANCDFASLPVGGIWNVLPPVESGAFTTFIFESPNLGATWDGAAWIQLADTSIVATFADLPSPAGVRQAALVLDNGFGFAAWVVYDGTDWLVFTTTAASGDLPADGVWSLSPSVISELDTVVNDSGTDAYWIWDGAAWAYYTQPTAPTVSVATFSLLPSDAIVGQRVSVTAETGLTGVICVNTGANTWEVETVTCAFSVLEAIAWSATPGTWYSSGGITVTTATGAVARQTTAGRSLVWWPTTTLGATGFFIPPDIYQRTPVLVGWLDGAEGAVARAAQGYTDALTGNGTITGNYLSGGETRLYGGLNASPATAQLFTSGTTTSGMGVYARALMRGANTHTTGTSEVAIRVAADGTNFDWLQQRDAGNFRLTDSANAAIDTAAILGTGSRLNGVAGAHEEIEVIDYGRAVTTRVHRNGLSYTAARRNGATTATSAPTRFAVGGTTTGSDGDLRIKHTFTITFTP